MIGESRERTPAVTASVGVAARDAIPLVGAGLLPSGTRISISHLGDETTAERLAAVRAVLDADLIPVPHLAARRFPSRAALDLFLRDLERAGAGEDVFVIGGDPMRPAGPYTDAMSLLTSPEFRSHGVRSVGVGGHPEGHPRIGDTVLWGALEEKTEWLGSIGLRCTVITQLSTDPAAVLAWIADARRRGIRLPFSVGLPGPLPDDALVDYPKRDRDPGRSGVPLAAPSLERVAPPADFVERLLARLDPVQHGVVELHVFGLGDPVDTARALRTTWSQRSAERTRAVADAQRRTALGAGRRDGARGSHQTGEAP